ncbi:tRNA (guanosine(46)-N7)-methyltransferase TrmB [Cyanobium gracile UHCC 0139]|uniref:tRNA (guanine-N(7)-)-methyltransferase n=1 Tax=Cyanobium gracile UHCC 0139 TaxID=3110308 RepID=A0ABU5RTX5_9CYAN|nr:tRNA (guanosine(46)-N7)-methyltransferase TrmB [Cyanobium gracile]MEA5391206.1 tRNA (guanosine(46)-N7)-methyltransferase TrmB [Cyanobium gracile UHCC 0139]
MRQHVNPLSRIHQLARPLPPLIELFADPSLPLHLDIGSARGRFLLAMAPLAPQRNHLGLEIRRPLVEAAEADRRRDGLANLRFLYGNANVNLPEWLAQLSPGQLELVTLQFPDPWFKLRHRKRRVLQPALLLAIAAALAPGRRLFLQSDVEALIAPMRQLVEASGAFELAGPEECGPTVNPLPVATEREAQVLAEGKPVHRSLYRRSTAPLPPLADLEAHLEPTTRGVDNRHDAEAD